MWTGAKKVSVPLALRLAGYAGRCPPYLRTSTVRPAAYRLPGASTPRHVRLRTKFGERAFSRAGPPAWYSLPPDIRAAVFKNLLKTHFLTAFPTG